MTKRGRGLTPAFLRVCSAALATLLAACGGGGDSIVVDKEVFIPGVQPRVDAIAKSRDGFVVAGFGLAAWVIATDDRGGILWRYSDAADVSSPAPSESVPQSEFHGIVVLASGNTLLCGGKYRSGDTDNLVVILDPHGSLVERRTEVPMNDPRFIHSNFYQCFPWRDGILLIGNTNDGTHGYVWLVELDGNGAKRREALVDKAAVASSAGFAGPSFVFTAWESQDSFRVIRANEKGETIAKRVLAGEFILQLRPVTATDETSILTYPAGRAVLHTLDAHLQDARPAIAIEGYFDPQAGRGYVLADGSLMLFGRRSNAVIALIGRQGKTRAIRAFDPKYTSFSVSDAVPISADRFVTVRGSLNQDPKEQGLVMSWISIKQAM